MINYIIDFFSVLPTFIISIISYKIITKSKVILNLKNVLLLLILNIIALLVRYTNIPILTFLSNITFIFIFLKIFFKPSFNKISYYCLIITLISLLVDSIMSLIISNSYFLNLETYIKNYYFRKLLNIPVCVAIILISLIPFIQNIINNFYNKYICKIKFNKINLLFLLTTSSIIFVFFCFNAYSEVNKFTHTIIILGTCLFIVLFNITLYLLYKEFQTRNLNKNIIEENKFIKYIAKQDEEFKHNIVNNLLGIKTVANKKTNILIDDLINSYQKEYKNITNINDLPNGVQSIIYSKAYKESIENLNLIVNNHIKNELYDILNPREYNSLCTAIGILFDNALDAIRNNKEKIIEINFEENKENIFITLKNSFSNIIDLEEIGLKNYSTKSNGHGIGINYIKKLKSIIIKNEIVNNMFITKLNIKKSKKYRN